MILGEIPCIHSIIHILARFLGFTLQKNQHHLDHTCSNKSQDCEEGQSKGIEK